MFEAAEFMPLYAHFFNISNLREIIYKKKPEFISNVLKNSGFWDYYRRDMTLLDVFNISYELLLDKYRCEYVYKNRLLVHELVEKKHPKLMNMFTEIYINKSKADMLVVNGTLTLYEIKTEIDNFTRLRNQLEDYTKAVEKVYVVVPEKKLNALEKELEGFEQVGVLIMGDSHEMEIEEYRPACSDLEKISQEHIFNTLNGQEIRKIFPDAEYQEAKKLFLEKSKKDCFEIFHKFLSKRKSYRQEFVSALPFSLKMAGFQVSKLTQKERGYFVDKIYQNFER
ncbi:sce7726 family protein [Geovibrio ferrireducens]|uniref:sce7726 family protein n=1 Tax=Geovibrio ferrireducens TaxID=46201 RepID=UPI002247B880|nr:sce7726 family protein [Geovibrio ferrireducens]